MQRHTTRARTAAEALSQNLSRSILDGELKPNQQLSEIAVSEKHGVSRNTLREAFRLLIQDGLLVHYPNRGVFVRSFTPDDLYDLYQYRRVFETACLRETFTRTDSADRCIVAMRAACEHASAAIAVGDWDDVAIANNRFHLAIFEAPENELILRKGQNVLALSRLVFMTSGKNENVHGPFIKKNQVILSLLEQGKIEEAVDHLSDYIDGSRDNMEKLLNNPV